MVQEWNRAVFYYLDDNDQWAIHSTHTRKFNEKDLLTEDITKSEDSYMSEKNIYDYDEAGRKILYEIYFWNNTKSDWNLSSREEYAYDQWDNMIMYAEYRSYSGTIYGGYRLDRTYNEQGQLTSRTYYHNWSNGVWEPESHRIYTYTASGKEKTTTVYDWEENDWVLDSKKTCIYDSRDSLIQYYAEGLNGLTYKEEYDYNADSNPLYVHCYSMLAGNWTIIESKDWTYNTQGLLIDYIRYYGSADEEDGKVVFYSPYECTEHFVNTYDESGKLLSHTESNRGDNGLFTSLEEKYTYDVLGRITSYIRRVADSNSTQLVNEFKQEIDYKDLAITQRVYDWDNEEKVWTLYSNETYHYDAKSKLATAWDYEDLWSKGHEEVEYDAMGRIKSYIHHWEDFDDPDYIEDEKRELFYNEEEGQTQMRVYELVDDAWQIDYISTYYWHYPTATGLEMLTENASRRPMSARKALINGRIIVNQGNRTIGINGIE